MADQTNSNFWTKWLIKAENQFDKLVLNAKARLHTSREPLIMPYIGHANDNKIFLRGRVLFGNKIRPASKTDSLWRNVVNSYHRFESDEIRYARVRASVNGSSKDVQCDEEGFFRVELDTPHPFGEDGYWQPVELELIGTPIKRLNDYNATSAGHVIVPPPTAQFAVVSDLDDTIMQTDVLNLFKMLRNTMLENAYTRLAFDGVPAFYHALHNGTINTQNPMFYVSSSPWNLYDAILDFYRIQDIPLGPIYLRDLGITANSIGGDGHMGHKLAFIQRLMDRHPNLPFILIGDSGQKDPHIYAEAVKRNPGQVLAIYIRDVAKPKRAAIVEQLADEIQQYNVDMVLIQNTLHAAKHAAEHGFINTAALENIREAMATTSV